MHTFYRLFINICNDKSIDDILRAHNTRLLPYPNVVNWPNLIYISKSIADITHIITCYTYANRYDKLRALINFDTKEVTFKHDATPYAFHIGQPVKYKDKIWFVHNYSHDNGYCYIDKSRCCSSIFNKCDSTIFISPDELKPLYYKVVSYSVDEYIPTMHMLRRLIKERQKRWPEDFVVSVTPEEKD